MFIFVVVNSLIVSFPQVKANCLQAGYDLLFTTTTSSRNIDWLNPAKGRMETGKNNINRSAFSFSYLRLFYLENAFNFGIKGGLVIPDQDEYERVYIGVQFRYQFSNSIYLFNDYSLSMATWFKGGGNSTREPFNQTWISLGGGIKIINSFYGTCSYTIPFPKTSALNSMAGYYHDETSFELRGFMHAGVEFYF